MGSKKGSGDENSLWEICIYWQIYAPSRPIFDHNHVDFAMNRKVGHYSSTSECSPAIIKTLLLVSQLNPWKPCLAQELSNLLLQRGLFHLIQMFCLKCIFLVEGNEGCQVAFKCGYQKHICKLNFFLNLPSTNDEAIKKCNIAHRNRSHYANALQRILIDGSPSVSVSIIIMYCI